MLFFTAEKQAHHPSCLAHLVFVRMPAARQSTPSSLSMFCRQNRQQHISLLTTHMAQRTLKDIAESLPKRAVLVLSGSVLLAALTGVCRAGAPGAHAGRHRLLAAPPVALGLAVPGQNQNPYSKSGVLDTYFWASGAHVSEACSSGCMMYNEWRDHWGSQ